MESKLIKDLYGCMLPEQHPFIDSFGDFSRCNLNKLFPLVKRSGKMQRLLNVLRFILNSVTDVIE